MKNVTTGIIKSVTETNNKIGKLGHRSYCGNATEVMRDERGCNITLL